MHRFSLISEVCNLVPKTICLGALLFLLFIVPSKSKVYNNTQGIIKMVPLSYMCVFVLIFLFGDFSRAYIHVYFFFFFLPFICFCIWFFFPRRKKCFVALISNMTAMSMSSLAHMFPNLWPVLAFYWNSLLQHFIAEIMMWYWNMILLLLWD